MTIHGSMAASGRWENERNKRLERLIGRWSDSVGTTYAVTLDAPKDGARWESASVKIQRRGQSAEFRKRIIWADWSGRVLWNRSYLLEKCLPDFVRWIHAGTGKQAFVWNRDDKENAQPDTATASSNQATL